MLEKLVNPATWSGAFIAGIGALTINQYLAFGGFTLAVLGFVVNLWHKWHMVQIARARLAKDLE